MKTVIKHKQGYMSKYVSCQSWRRSKSWKRISKQENLISKVHYNKAIKLLQIATAQFFLPSTMDSSYTLRQFLYYKVRHDLLQIGTDVTKSYDYYSWRKKRFNLNKFLSLSFRGDTYKKPAWYNCPLKYRPNFIHKTHHLSMWIR